MRDVKSSRQGTVSRSRPEASCSPHLAAPRLNTRASAPLGPSRGRYTVAGRSEVEDTLGASPSRAATPGDRGDVKTKQSRRRS